ncbi:MAG: 30S ribosomal protein S2 [Candidatus Yanofskybacteria bacterium RIFCSPHIGHO2_02_FULL_44_12b]|nr:MAG: 30S ribosomal protein S2 [Candidatus Yanofskybacteria bacterium RIFCSPHIGHO2_01_FULL_44_24]OGN16003.1 MAG: 30S ribosomal protein S2 [Candidatus Yanofskybacteria bacterium RIFCSPHIGHO2_02_FULL_44_12b]OGN25514.1 MAG: 30S ribosomal protein S2 [Candidatus Yanofskybacteria bacterium RIFCSPLOWO2_01_FULL_44_22]
MLRAGAHFGRKKTVFNPAMKKFVFTVRNGVCIIDLLKTQTELQKALDHLKGVKEKNGLILFVALTKQSLEGIKELAESLGMPYVLERWLGGTLTNFKELNGRVKKMEEMEKQKAEGGLDKYTKKERTVFNKALEKMQKRFNGLRKLVRLPDVVFVSSLKEGALPVREAKRMGVKVVAICNTDANPDNVDFAIPANDKSKKSVDLIIELLKNNL